jgi:hypothetical protein
MNFFAFDGTSQNQILEGGPIFWWAPTKYQELPNSAATWTPDGKQTLPIAGLGTTFTANPRAPWKRIKFTGVVQGFYSTDCGEPPMLAPTTDSVASVQAGCSGGQRFEIGQLLRSGRVFANTGTEGNVALQFPSARLRNPVGSGVKGLIFVSTGNRFTNTGNIMWGISIAGDVPVDFPTNIDAFTYNLLAKAAAPGKLRASSGNFVSTPSNPFHIRYVNIGSFELLPWGSTTFIAEIPEGCAFDIFHGSPAGDLMRFNFVWAEVPAAYL